MSGDTGGDTRQHPADAATDLWGRVLAIAEELSPEDWRRPTPCEHWDVHALLTHLSGAQTFFDGTAPQPQPPEGWEPPQGRGDLDRWAEAGVAARGDWTPEHVRAELSIAAMGHEERLRAVTDWDEEAAGPTGRTTESGLFAVRCYDLWVHLQDLHESLGQPIDLEDDSFGAQAAYRFVLDRLPWIYAKRVGAPEGAALRLALHPASSREAILTVIEGRAGFVEDADPGDNVVEVHRAALTLLVSGRGDEQHWRERGVLRWDGDHGEAFVLRARLFA